MPSDQKLVIGAAIVLAFGLGVGVGWSLRGGGEKPIVADGPRTPKAPASASKAPSPHHEVKLDGPWVEDDDPFVWPTTEPIGSELVRADDEHFMLDAKLVALVSENQAELARSARIVPVLEAEGSMVSASSECDRTRFSRGSGSAPTTSYCPSTEGRSASQTRRSRATRPCIRSLEACAKAQATLARQQASSSRQILRARNLVNRRELRPSLAA